MCRLCLSLSRSFVSHLFFFGGDTSFCLLNEHVRFIYTCKRPVHSMTYIFVGLASFTDCTVFSLRQINFQSMWDVFSISIFSFIPILFLFLAIFSLLLILLDANSFNEFCRNGNIEHAVEQFTGTNSHLFYQIHLHCMAFSWWRFVLFPFSMLMLRLLLL